MSIKPTRFYSKRQEDSVAKAIGGKRVANSGATPFSKGDVTADNFLIECKTKTSPSQTMTIHKEWFDKNKEEAFAMRKDYSAVVVSFGDGENFYIIDENLFTKLYNYLKEIDSNGE